MYILKLTKTFFYISIAVWKYSYLGKCSHCVIFSFDHWVEIQDSEPNSLKLQLNLHAQQVSDGSSIQLLSESMANCWSFTAWISFNIKKYATLNAIGIYFMHYYLSACIIWCSYCCVFSFFKWIVIIIPLYRCQKVPTTP